MMKICEILEMDNIEKGSPIELSDEHKNSVFFLKKGL
jgi:CRP/FNR family cyclic AMP-dependent transcriptional regulator